MGKDLENVVSQKSIQLLLFPAFILVLNFISVNSIAQQKDQKHYTLLGLGDSITEGGSNFNSYLYPLWEKLFVAGYQVEFIGPKQAKSKIGGIPHAGYSGMNAEFLAAKVDSIYGKYPADIVLIHTGHNHFVEEEPVSGIISAQNTIVDQIKKINPEAIILLAKVVESGKLPKYSYIPELNQEIEFLVSKLQNSYEGIYLVDQSKEIDWQRHTIEDKVHPNDAGAEVMAKVWFENLQKILQKPAQAFHPEILSYKITSSRSLNLHIFNPPDQFKEEKKPCLLYFFGGGWQVGTPLQFYREASYFSTKGIVAISADYRTEFEDGTTVFESLKDAKSAIRWIREHAFELGIDPEKIVVAGASAGGYLAAATASVSGFEEPEENLSVSSKPNLNLLYYPVLDNGPDGYGGSAMKAKYQEVSPFHQNKKLMPPTLFVLGTEDPLFSVSKAKEYKSQLENNGIDCELKLFEGAGHPIFYYREGFSSEYFQILQDTEEFLKKYEYLN